MNKRKWFLLLLAILLVLGASQGSAWAYFTASETVTGGYVLSLTYTPPMEEVVDGDKTVWFHSDKDAPPVFVRVKAFTGELFQDDLVYTSDGDNWIEDAYTGDGSSGYWYYMIPLEGGDESDKLYISVSAVLPEVGPEIEEQANVIVIYESVPAVYKSDGSPDFENSWKYGKPSQG